MNGQPQSRNRAQRKRSGYKTRTQRTLSRYKGADKLGACAVQTQRKRKEEKPRGATHEGGQHGAALAAARFLRICAASRAALRRSRRRSERSGDEQRARARRRPPASRREPARGRPRRTGRAAARPRASMGAAKLGDTETVTQHGQGRRAKTLSRALVADSEAALHTPTKTQHKTVEKRETATQSAPFTQKHNRAAVAQEQDAQAQKPLPRHQGERDLFFLAPVDNTTHTHLSLPPSLPLPPSLSLPPSFPLSLSLLLFLSRYLSLARSLALSLSRSLSL